MADFDPLDGSLADLLSRLGTLGVTPDVTGIGDRADQAFARVAEAVRSEKPLDTSTWAMVERTIGNAFEDVLKRQMRGVVRGVRLGALAPDAEDDFIWIAVMDDGTCDSCGNRHGDAKPMRQWEAEGMPGDPTLICDGACRCQLLPLPASRGDVQVDVETPGATP